MAENDQIFNTNQMDQIITSHIDVLETKTISNITGGKFNTESELLRKINEGILSAKELREIAVKIIKSFDYTGHEMVMIITFMLRKVFDDLPW